MAIERFADFELDDEARQLRLRGREVQLQPRIFDLLTFLVRNRQRVVDKDELLAEIWPGVIVTDASLQRAVSLARRALREGGLEKAIRTYSRRGYRFCLEGAPAASPDPTGHPAPASPLDRARVLLAQRHWDEAVELFARADSEQSLDAADLESWAVAAQCAGALRDAVAPLERAAEAYCAAGDAEACARAHILLARIQLESREVAVANGCLRRAATLLADLPLGEQHGHLQWMLSRYWAYAGDLEKAEDHARRTMEIGRELASEELQLMGRLYLGVALQAKGDVSQGLGLQDEAAATVLAGQVPPLLGGIVYCGVIAGCANHGDWPRAAQWTESFSRWCERSHLRTFAGSCLLHRAEIFAVRGDLERAQRELTEGRETLSASAPWAMGDAFRLLGDLYLTLGSFDLAENHYRRAHEHGWEPYPGYALLLHYRGQSEAAVRGLRRALSASHWVAGERAGLYLAFLVSISAQSGDTATASAAMADLDARTGLWESGAAQAHVFRARGELCFAVGDVEDAIAAYLQSLQAWAVVDAPLEAALVRLSLARAYHAANEGEQAALELCAADAVFARANAAYYLELSAEIRRSAALGPEMVPPAS